jgi:hypothetical protein
MSHVDHTVRNGRYIECGMSIQSEASTLKYGIAVFYDRCEVLPPPSPLLLNCRECHSHKKCRLIHIVVLVAVMTLAISTMHISQTR